MRLRYLGLAGDMPYRSHTVSAWAVGEVREVDGATAAYLLETFPAAFVVVGAPALDESPIRAAIESAPVKRASRNRKG